MPRRPLLRAASMLLFALAALPAHAQLIRQDAKLVGTGASGNANQGAAAAVSADGNTAAVGGTLDNGGVGVHA